MNNQLPFMFMTEDNFNILNDIKNLYSQINSIQQQLNLLQKKIDTIEQNKPSLKLSPIPMNNNTNYPSDNYII